MCNEDFNVIYAQGLGIILYLCEAVNISKVSYILELTHYFGMMQLKKFPAFAAIIFLALAAFMLAGCNDDVFVPRPDFKSYTASVGDIVKFKIPDKTDISDVWVEITYGNDSLPVYTGGVQWLKSELLGVSYSLDSSSSEAEVVVDYNHYPGPVNIAINNNRWNGCYNIKVRPESTSLFSPGEIEYDVSQWLVDSDKSWYANGVKDNKTSEMITVEIRPQINCPLSGYFEFDDPSAFYLFGDRTFTMPTLAIDRRGFPIKTDIEIPLSSAVSEISGFDLECDEPYRAEVPPGSYIQYLIGVDYKVYILDFILPVTNPDGVTLNLSGKLTLRNPEKYEFTIAKP